MSKYQKSKLYEILFLDTNDSYIGQTIQPLKDRLSNHKTQGNGMPKLMGDAFKRNTNYKIVLLEKYPCNDIEELSKREQYWIDKKKPSLNGCKAYSETNRAKTKTHHCDVCKLDIVIGKLIKHHLNIIFSNRQ